jgi:predicted kinase
VEAVILIGLQGAGKSTFARERFLSTHVLISLDILKTRHRERTLMRECLDTKQPFVVDNTNPARTDREAYILPARQSGYRVVGYYFQSRVEDCHRRNSQRSPAERVPLLGVLGTARRLEIPRHDEGFDALYYVRIDDGGQFSVEEWLDEV